MKGIIIMALVILISINYASLYPIFSDDDKEAFALELFNDLNSRLKSEHNQMSEKRKYSQSMHDLRCFFKFCGQPMPSHLDIQNPKSEQNSDAQIRNMINDKLSDESIRKLFRF